MMVLVAVNERGQRVGESHPSARLTDHEVDLFFALHDEEGWGCRRLSRHFEISKTAARKILRGECRSQRAVRWKAGNLSARGESHNVNNPNEADDDCR